MCACVCAGASWRIHTRVCVCARMCMHVHNNTYWHSLKFLHTPNHRSQINTQAQTNTHQTSRGLFLKTNRFKLVKSFVHFLNVL